MRKIALALFALLISSASALAQVTGLPAVPLGYCQMTSVSASAGITPANCIRASFTGTATGLSLVVTSVTGIILPGDGLAGTGVPTGTTYIAAQVSGTPNGAGTYLTNQATTASAASLTSGGIPQAATTVNIEAEAQIVRYRDDTGAPTAAVGMPIATGQTVNYSGTISKLRFIQATAGAIINLLFYR